MPFPTRSVLPLVSLLAVLAVPAMGQETFRLPKTHAFKVGDVEDCRRALSTKYSEFRLPARTLRRSRFDKYTEHRRIEVLEIDEAGRPMLVRFHIVLSKRWTTLTTPAEERGRWKAELRDIRFLARREGLFFRPDTRTITVPAGTKLTQGQVDHLREHVDNLQSMFSSRENYALLLPSRPVELHQSWKPSAAILEEFVRLDPDLLAVGTKVTGAELTLRRVSSRVATIGDRMRMTNAEKGTHYSDEFEGETDLDLDTGLASRVQRDAKIHGTTKDHRSTTWIGLKATTTLVPGDGTASKPPAGLEEFKLPAPAPEPTEK